MVPEEAMTMLSLRSISNNVYDDNIGGGGDVLLTRRRLRLG